MKLRHIKHRGFTLIEVLVVIAILAMLAAASWTAMGYIEESKLTKKAETQIAVLADALVDYQEDNSCFPWGKGDEASSNELYMALSGDYDGDGKADDDGTGNSRRIYCRQLTPVGPTEPDPTDGIPCRKVNIRGVGSVYAIMDPWGRPYRYRLGNEETSSPADRAAAKGKRNKNPNTKPSAKSKGTKGPGINTDFDIFSLGGDGEGDCKTKTGKGNDDNISNIKW